MQNEMAWMDQLKTVRIKSIFERYGIYIFLVILFIFASIVSPGFLRPQNLRDVLNQAAPLGIVSIGQTFVILTGGGGVDLSIASVMATVAVIVAYITAGQNALLLAALGICIPFGLLMGYVNGLLVTKRRVPPFMATLGMMIIIQGFRFLFTKGAPKGDLPPFLRVLGTETLGPIPISIISLAVLSVAAALVLRRTAFGRQVYAVGGNRTTAHISGYNTDLVITIAYVVSGFTAAIGGIYLAGWIGIIDNWVGRGYELNSIAAVVMGGTSFEGGRGGVLGTLGGVLIMTMLFNIVLLLHFPVQTQLIVKGFVIVLAAALYVRRSER
jgi:ribose/xylose/arabinose/galactoside ABC-type transport system permease subunit